MLVTWGAIQSAHVIKPKPSTNLTFDTKSVTQLRLAASELAVHFCDRPSLNAPCM